MTRNEKEFLEWINRIPYKKFESNEKIHLYHYSFIYAGFGFHISFSDRDTVICGVISIADGSGEQTIYKGFSWDYCLAEINKYIGRHA